MAFVCTQCGYETLKWMGRCPNCGSWNTFVELEEEKKKGWIAEGLRSSPLSLKEIRSRWEKKEIKHIKTEIGEVDRVLGSGIFEGSLIIMGGDPGVGKSTLALQIAGKVADRGYKVLYVSAEESQEQVFFRAKRLDINSENLYIASLTSLREIIDSANKLKPNLLIIDSIQTVINEDTQGIPGSISQVRNCTQEIMKHAKTTSTPVILIGHVTKDGTLAGPKTIEHMVDVILFMEALQHNLRLLRCTKNRFGGTNELGLFEITEKGLLEIREISEIFLEKREKSIYGVSVVPILEGIRPILVEIEALVSKSSFAIPQRNVTGYDYKRVNMIIALLETHLGIILRNYDIYVNVSRGIYIEESAADLGVLASLISAYTKKPPPPKSVFLGEISLTGEIRQIRDFKRRVLEAKRVGFEKFITGNKEIVEGVDIISVKNIEEVFKLCF